MTNVERFKNPVENPIAYDFTMPLHIKDRGDFWLGSKVTFILINNRDMFP